ncbi:MAG: dihydroorotate dehydrogenase-like protein [Deltaproteobacteria bacterium]|nr:dihydroorotate dehydrogenase-like protein [Deltaproteobacteria bacterium]
MDTTTRWLGFDLPHPFVAGSSPLLDDLDTARRLEDAGAAALVMRSLFEEQLIREELATHAAMEAMADSSGEAAGYFPRATDFSLGPHEYLEQIRRVKAVVRVPVVASLNGVHPGHWHSYASQVQQAGADALELNVYRLVTDPEVSGAQVEADLVELVSSLRGALSIPLAVKLSPAYSSLANLAVRLDRAGADGLVLFNRFYQPDIDIDALEVRRQLTLSTSSDLLVRLRWLAILHGRVRGLAVTGGVHTVDDGIKAIMAGADAVQLVSALLQDGPRRITALRDGLARWLEEKEYESLAQMKGSMSLGRVPDPDAFERANYLHVLQSWK